MSELGGEFPFEPSSSELPDSTEQDLPSPARIPLIKRIGNVCTAAVSDFKESPATDRPKKEIHELNLNASADGAAAIGAVVLGVAEVIVKIGESNPALAEHIQNTASDIRVWYGVAGLMMAQQFISKKFKQRREAKNQKNQVEVVEPAISEE
jgi:hypothetical protein